MKKVTLALLSALVATTMLSGCVSMKTDEELLSQQIQSEKYNENMSYAMNVFRFIDPSSWAASSIKDKRIPKEQIQTNGSVELFGGLGISAVANSMGTGVALSSSVLGFSAMNLLTSNEDTVTGTYFMTFVPVSKFSNEADARAYVESEIAKAMRYGMEQQNLDVSFFGKWKDEMTFWMSNEELNCPSLETIKKGNIDFVENRCQSVVRVTEFKNENKVAFPAMKNPKWIDEKETLSWRFQGLIRTNADPFYAKRKVDLPKLFADIATKMPEKTLMHIGSHFTLQKAKIIGYERAVPYVTDGKTKFYYVMPK